MALARCLIGSHEARVAALATILSTTRRAPARDLRKCRATVAGAVKASWLQHARELHRCKLHPPAERVRAGCSIRTVERVVARKPS
jgi:hypothetical protein